VPAYLARHKELRDEARVEDLNRLKEQGRYEVSYGPAPAGDIVKKEDEPDWTGSRTLYRVEDRMTYKTVVVMDGPDKELGIQTFIGKYPEERIEAMRASHRESRRLAEEEARRLNKVWAGRTSLGLGRVSGGSEGARAGGARAPRSSGDLQCLRVLAGVLRSAGEGWSAGSG